MIEIDTVLLAYIAAYLTARDLPTILRKARASRKSKTPKHIPRKRK